MFRFIVKRILFFIPTVLGVLLIVFAANTLTPADPVYSILGMDITQEQYDLKAEELGLDKPFVVQYVNYVKGVVLHLDLGTSFHSKQPVASQILERLPITIKLGLTSLLITMLLGIPFGIISATRQYSALDYCVTVMSLFFASMPNFWFGLMLILFFALRLGWFPATGVTEFAGWILPCITMGIAPIASITRITRSSMLDVVRQDYIRTARSKGLTERSIIWKHAMRNALIPIITVIGFQASMIMGGSAVVEAIFRIPGLGSLMLTAINQSDYPLIMGSILFVSVVVCIINLVVDLLYAFIDPRITSQYRAGSKAKKSPKPVKPIAAGGGTDE